MLFLPNFVNRVFDLKQINCILPVDFFFDLHAISILVHSIIYKSAHFDYLFILAAKDSVLTCSPFDSI